MENYNIYPEIITLPDKIDCHHFVVDLPDPVIIIAVDLVEEHKKNKLRFWLARNNGKEKAQCDFYLIKKSSLANYSLPCPTNKKIVPLVLFNHPNYIL